MIYRKIQKEEMKAFANLSATAFHSDAKEQYEDIEKGGFLQETIRVMADDGNKITAGLRLIELYMYLDTGYVKCGGIGDVSSYPEYRRTGNIAKLMKNALREMYDEDYVISYLYPFSHPFYRKYGYELCREKQEVTIKTQCIKYEETSGHVKQHVYGTDSDLSEDIKKVYYLHAAKMNMMVDRRGYFWDRKLKDDAYTSKIKTYVIYDDTGEPKAYMRYEYERMDFPNIRAKIYDIAFVDRKAFDELLMFIYKLGPSISEFVFACPPKLAIFNALDDAWDVKMKVEPAGMMRIINVQKAFDAIKAIELQGSILVKVSDGDIAENNGVFKINSENGIIKAEKVRDDKFDLSCPINILSQLVCGFRVLDEVEHLDSVIIKSKKEEIDRLFHKKQIHIQDYF